MEVTTKAFFDKVAKLQDSYYGYFWQYDFDSGEWRHKEKRGVHFGERMICEGWELVCYSGKPRNAKDEAEYRQFELEDEPKSPPDWSEKDGLQFHWERVMNMDKKYMGPWVLYSRPIPNRRCLSVAEAERLSLDPDGGLPPWENIAEYSPGDSEYTRLAHGG